MLKIGITAVHRGNSRLLEQGAIGYTIIATGGLPKIRHAELTVAGSGLAKERLRVKAKVEAWWLLPDSIGLTYDLEAARTKAVRVLADHDIELIPEGPVVDNTDLFGLADGAPSAYTEVEGLADVGVLSGALAPPIGKHLLVDADGYRRPLLLDTRLLAGRSLRVVSESSGPEGPQGLWVAERRKPVQFDAPTLF
jgi:hypothetical protein